MSAIYLCILFGLLALRTFAAAMFRSADRKEKRADNRAKAIHARLARDDEESLILTLPMKRDFKTEARQAEAVREYGVALAYADRCAEKSLRWGARMKALSEAVSWFWKARGRAIPYTFGILDSATAMIALDQVAIATGQTIPEVLNGVLAWVTG